MTEKEQAEQSLRNVSLSSVDATGTSPRQMNKYAWAALVASVLSATFTFALDNTIVAVVQPRIIDELGEIEKLSWIIVAFELGAASANLCWGKLYGKFDHKLLFLASIALFEIGSAICGAAPTLNALIVGRLICGLGGNGIYLGTMNIISNLTSIQERPIYLSFFGLVWGSGTVLGPIVGGAFISNARVGWRWAFYINLCISGLFAPIYLFILPSHNPLPGLSIWQRLCSLDFAGAILFIGAYVSGILAVSFGGTEFAWSSAEIIALFCTSGVLWIMFTLQQKSCVATSKQERLFPAHLLHDWENWVFFAQTASSITALFLPVYFIPLYFQFVRSDSALQSGIKLLPLICVCVFFCLLNGALMGKWGYYMPWFAIGAAAIVVGSALMRTVGPDTADSTVYGYSVILAAGVGSFVQASFPIVQAKEDPKESANVLSFVGCAQLFGLAMGFSIGYAIFINTVTNRIAHILPNVPIQQVQAAIAGVGATIFQDLSDDDRERVLTAVSTSIGDVYVQVLAGGAFSLALALFMKREKLFVQKKSE